MPIRFRCEHCDQLLGIARRKAGTLVRCPNCQRDVQVPSEPASPLPVAEPLAAAAAPPVGLFDRDDFDVLLQGGAPPATESSRAPANGQGVAPPPPPPPPPAPMASVGGTLGLDRWAPSPSGAGAGAAGAASGAYPAPNGVVLSPLLATVLTVAVILLVASAFGIGVLVGRWWVG